MVRGTKYLLYLKNYNVDLTQLSVPSTNIHTHGLMVHGSSNADDISRVMTAGDGEECIAYNYTILPEHAGGLCWYHAHAHGSTNPQVSNGAYGALIITDQAPDGTWPQFPQDVSTRGLEEMNSIHHERLVFFGAVDNDWHVNGVAGDANIHPIYENTWYRL
jgi:FtsP/CotA-like multicopper oxidase with cupredoxin domain